MIESVAFLFRVPLPVGLSTVVVAPTTCSLTTCSYYLYMLAERSKNRGGMLAERSKNGVCNVGGKVVENSPESHKPVEIGDYTASDDSEIGDTPEKRSNPARKGR